MRIIADLHVHGRYSRATSQKLTIKNLEKFAVIKGVNLLGTGDFTHPLWIKELKTELIEDGSGVLRTKNGFPFILQTEVSLVYTQDNKGRKIHLVVLAKNFEVVDSITEELKKHGRVDYDGRPIFNMSCPVFVEIVKSIDDSVEIIPAHIWTPWFSLFGSNSGFDSVKECFQDTTRHIHALETGLSSDPAMNWRLSQLDNYSLVSFSDLHSFWPWRIGREATVFEINKLTYQNIIKALKTRQGLVETIEVDPSYGKYHYDGHRNCNVSLSPREAIRHNNICPKCKKRLTIGVLHRVEELADRPEGFKPKCAVPFRTLIPLSEILSTILKKSISSQQVWNLYYKLVNNERSEFDVLLDMPHDKLTLLTNKTIADAIIDNRNGKIVVKPGFDGEYGIPLIGGKILENNKKKLEPRQTGLKDFC